ncbi:DUF3750 domain-containing protein [Halotalea alkalilenta]|uniref:DUF3750 domain-containing protein n=1 Tax=Halotalea alkalilenta TaxID=376489 RepID=UPI0009DDA5AD|nr:DUF3750 domain-containing protein [Halotalea alkalilenta]
MDRTQEASLLCALTKRAATAFALLLLALALLLSGPLSMLALQRIDAVADTPISFERTSAGLAPSPADTPEAVVQVYAVRLYDWRGAFAVHTWIAAKPANASAYTTYQVYQWRTPHVSVSQQIPDRMRRGTAPMLLGETRGATAERAIEEIRRAVADYPAANHYRAWPGPNSNTFIAWVLRRTPELSVVLPATAIGKDYPIDGFLASTPSGTGYQLSLAGMLGISLGLHEGIEFNLLGLNFGTDFLHPAIKLPGIGRIGMPAYAALDTVPANDAETGANP